MLNSDGKFMLYAVQCNSDETFKFYVKQLLLLTLDYLTRSV